MIEPFPDVFPEFVEAARHGIQRVISVSDVGEKEGLTLAKSIPLRIEAAPVFDWDSSVIYRLGALSIWIGIMLWLNRAKKC